MTPEDKDSKPLTRRRRTTRANPKPTDEDKPEATPSAGAPAESTAEPKPQKKSNTPERRVETKAPQETSSVKGADADKKIRDKARARSIDPSKIKLQQFPPAQDKRPEFMSEEEERRHLIDQLVEQHREKKIQELEHKFQEAKEKHAKKGDDEALASAKRRHDEGLKRLRDQWATDDGLLYRADPDDEEIEVYPVQEGYSYVQIIRNKRTHELSYHVIEPRLTPDEIMFLGFIEKTLVDVLDLQPSELDNTELKDYITQKFDQVMEEYSIVLHDDEDLAAASRRRLMYYVLRDFMGEGPIDVMMNDPMIEDISCDGPHVPIFVYHRKYEALTSTVRWKGHDQLDSFVIRMAQRAGKHINIADPILDGTMRDGSRLQATLAKEVSSYGSTFTLRKFKDVPFTPVDLVRFGTLSSEMMAYIWMVIEAHMSAIYAGGTASGKTTSINALMMFIPPQNKVITIEDTRELQVPEPNWIAGITRGGFGPRDEHGRQAGEIDMFQLLKNALRQRPEYIIVGEVRGAEAYSLFQAMATGHAAYGTMHADSVDAVIHRLNSDPINIPRSLLEALDVVAVQSQVRVGGKRARRTRELQEIVGLDPNTQEILTNSVFTWDPANDEFIYSGSSYNLERIAAETGRTIQQVTADMKHRAALLDHMVKMEVTDYAEVAQIIKNQYRDPDQVAAWMKEGKPWH